MTLMLCIIPVAILAGCLAYFLLTGSVYTFGRWTYREDEPYPYWSSIAVFALALGGFLLIIASQIHANMMCPNPELSQHFWRCD